MAESTPTGLAEFTRELTKLTAASHIVSPVIFNLPGERAGRYAIVTPSPAGKPASIEVKLTEPDWHSEELEDIEQLAKFIVATAATNEAAGAIYIGAEQVVYVFDFEDRRDRATVSLETTKPWDWLAIDQHPMSQAQIIRLLRITFDRCLPPDSALVNVLRQVKFTTGATVEANIQRGKEALGKQIMSEAAGVSNFPDEFVLQVNVFKGLNRPKSVRVALEILPDVSKFELIPFPGEIDASMRDTLADIQEELAATKVPTFIGSV